MCGVLMPIGYDFKYTLCKIVDDEEVIGYSKEHADYNVAKSLQAFMYNMQGCMTGWYNEEVNIDDTKVCYTCSIPYGEEESLALTRYVEALEEDYNIYRIDEGNNVFMIE
jgi:hypothetical protein